MKLLENFGDSSKVFSRCFTIFLNPRKTFGNLRKCSEIFGNFRKTSETVQKYLSDVFMTFLKFSENIRKYSEVFGNCRKLSGRDWKCS